MLQNKVKIESLRHVVQISNQTAELLFVIHDDTISKKTKPSSRAQSPMEQTSFRHSHLEGKVVWGHQVQATVVQSGDTSLIHSIDLYDKMKTHPDGTIYTKIDHVCNMAATFPLHGGYVLVDSWFTCARVINSYASAGYHLIGVYADLSGLVVGDRPHFERFMNEPLFMDHFRRALVYSDHYEKILFGTDWPLAPIDLYAEFVRRLVPEQHHEKVFYQNAFELFPRIQQRIAAL